MKAYYICPDTRGDFRIFNFSVFIHEIGICSVYSGEVKWFRVPAKDIVYFYLPDKQAKDLSMYESDQLKRFIERLKK